MAGATWRRYWPWWIALGWLIAYEVVALATAHPTLSRMVWNGQASWPALVWVVTGITVVLWVHFFAKRR